MSANFQKKDIEFSIDGEAPDILIDPARLKQAIINLTDNACKHVPEGDVYKRQAYDCGSFNKEWTAIDCKSPEGKEAMIDVYKRQEWGSCPASSGSTARAFCTNCSFCTGYARRTFRAERFGCQQGLP